MLWIEIDNACQAANIPSKALFELWISTTLAGKSAEIGIRLVSPTEIKKLNQQFRNTNQITDVLSFPYQFLGDEQELPYLGDIAICVEQLQQDAKRLNKHELEHWAHLSIHCILHLLGYDHQNPKDQAEMQQLENQIMQELKYAAPWRLVSPEGV